LSLDNGCDFFLVLDFPRYISLLIVFILFIYW